MRTIVIDMRAGFDPEKMTDDDRIAKFMGQGAVNGMVWNTDQQLSAHVLEKLYSEGFYVLRVLS